MSREIKFRAYSHKDKKFYMWEELSFEEIGEMLKGIPDCEINQYIGLKDKNGKEIYEGDVLRLHCFNHNLITATVEWSQEQAKFYPNIHDKEIIVDGGTNHGKSVKMSTVHSWAGCHSCWSFERYTEVIGNIYENRELLK